MLTEDETRRMVAILSETAGQPCAERIARIEQEILQDGSSEGGKAVLLPHGARQPPVEWRKHDRQDGCPENRLVERQ